MKSALQVPKPGLFILALFLALLPLKVLPQIFNIGKIESWKTEKYGLSGKTATAFFRISVYNAATIRVRISGNPVMDGFSYSLDAAAVPVNTGFSVKESGESILLGTERIDMEILRVPAFRVIFRSKEGKVINEDVAGEGFGTTLTGNRPTLYKKLFPGERFVGLGEVLGNLDKRGSAYTLNNTDTYRYGDPRLPMYVSIPFYIGLHDREVYGLFYHNTYKTYFNFGISTPDFISVTAEGGDADYFFIYDTSIGNILGHYTSLTGRMPLPPCWSLGYHQSRCSYFPQDNVKILADIFRAKRIPADCIVLDADYLQDYEPFRINTSRFPDMKGLTSYLKSIGFEVTASVNPGIKLDSTYLAYHEGLSADVFVKYTDGSLFTAEIAPSLNHFVDFTMPRARVWWADQMKFLPENGIHGYWNDMNEPAVGGSYLPDNLLFDFDGRKAGAREVKNLYGMLMARSSYESALKYGGNRRPFVLTRSGFAGVQRYAAVWTGDNTAKDEYLLGGVLLNTQLGLSGLSFVGDDIGGYIGNTSKELYTRWIETGIFAPFVRNHKEAFATANEPWSYGEEAEAVSREYIGFRYRLLPYLYSLFHECTQTGMPVVRSLCINDPFDDKVYDPLYQYQFLCGDAILVVPVTSSEQVKKFYLPGGTWYDLFSDEIYHGQQELSRECRIYEVPLFVRSSSVIPMHKLVQNTKENPGDTLFIHFYHGDIQHTFTYYEDDGISMDYRQGDYYKREINFDPQMHQIRFGKKEGNYSSSFKTVRCIFHGFNNLLSTLTLNGAKVQLIDDESRMLDGLRYLDKIYDPSYFRLLRSQEKSEPRKAIVFPHADEQMILSWKPQ